jgi:Tfp pilus assembly PilM family ATPase
MKKSLESLGISKHNIRLNIPRHLVTVRFVKLPSTDEAEIKLMAGSEALKHVPYADEEIVSCHRVIEKTADGYSNVMIAVAQADTVRKV